MPRVSSKRLPSSPFICPHCPACSVMSTMVLMMPGLRLGRLCSLSGCKVVPSPARGCRKLWQALGVSACQRLEPCWGSGSGRERTGCGRQLSGANHAAGSRTSCGRARRRCHVRGGHHSGQQGALHEHHGVQLLPLQDPHAALPAAWRAGCILLEAWQRCDGALLKLPPPVRALQAVTRLCALLPWGCCNMHVSTAAAHVPSLGRCLR